MMNNPKFPFTLIDLTHPLSTTIPTWDGAQGFGSTLKVDYADCTTSVKFRVQNFTMQAGAGTHLDAPAHCIENGATTADLPLQKLFVPCAVINVTAQADEHYRVSPQDIIDFEKQHGTIKPGSFVIIYTGWDRWWRSPERYRNELRFPSISADAAALLLERTIVGIGIDTLGVDRPEDGYPVHQLVLSAGCYLVENVANAGDMPAVGGFVAVLPIKAVGLTEAPIRLVGMVGLK